MYYSSIYRQHKELWTSHSMEKAFLNLPSIPSNYESICWFYVKEFLCENNCYASKDFLCGQMKDFSDIEDCVVDYNDYFLKGYAP